MTKKHFIELADDIREHNRWFDNKDWDESFTPMQLDALAKFCRAQNPRFDRERWLSYIRGECGPGGGKIKQRRFELSAAQIEALNKPRKAS